MNEVISHRRELTNIRGHPVGVCSNCGDHAAEIERLNRRAVKCGRGVHRRIINNCKRQ
jgi:hypothetical protein